MENTTAQEKVTTHCHACFDEMKVSAKEYDREKKHYEKLGITCEPRFYCSKSCLYCDLL